MNKKGTPMKLTITNIEVNLYSELADSFCVSGDVVGTGHCHYYVSRHGQRTLPDAIGTGYPIIYINKGHGRPRRTDTVWGKAFVEMTLAYADSLKLWDAAEAVIAEKAVQERKANVERRKIARMRDHAESMYALLKEVFSQMKEQFVPTNADMGDYASDYRAIESLLNEIDNDPPQTSNETP
jgi:hypothetical protein